LGQGFLRHAVNPSEQGDAKQDHGACNTFSDESFSLDNWRIGHFLATEIFRQASGMMSEVGSVQLAHDRASEETPRHMAEN